MSEHADDGWAVGYEPDEMSRVIDGGEKAAERGGRMEGSVRFLELNYGIWNFVVCRRCRCFLGQCTGEEEDVLRFRIARAKEKGHDISHVHLHDCSRPSIWFS